MGNRDDRHRHDEGTLGKLTGNVYRTTKPQWNWNCPNEVFGFTLRMLFREVSLNGLVLSLCLFKQFVDESNTAIEVMAGNG
jgi:hypothetical protein